MDSAATRLRRRQARAYHPIMLHLRTFAGFAWVLTLAALVVLPERVRTQDTNQRDRQALQKQLKATFDREMARHDVGDCPGALTTVDINTCVGKNVPGGHLRARVRVVPRWDGGRLDGRTLSHHDDPQPHERARRHRWRIAHALGFRGHEWLTCSRRSRSSSSS